MHTLARLLGLGWAGSRAVYSVCILWRDCLDWAGLAPEQSIQYAYSGETAWARLGWPQSSLFSMHTLARLLGLGWAGPRAAYSICILWRDCLDWAGLAPEQSIQYANSGETAWARLGWLQSSLFNMHTLARLLGLGWAGPRAAYSVCILWRDCLDWAGLAPEQPIQYAYSGETAWAGLGWLQSSLFSMHTLARLLGLGWAGSRAVYSVCILWRDCLG
ncbi:hypothetical protein DPMN_170573 [Dreissena polymorpha]|uniref:Uncharacterized protein n=1 Tax=Dreissena polymorpha TaxID=45954 RepID=A0A9D4IEQ3_DREPO|nr:hypothetical protein DPMN_170573 [Dreissena polymorpha]